MRRAAGILLTLLWSAYGASVEDRIAKIIEGSPEARQAFWGIRVVDPETGQVLYAQNADKFFVPASNTKLFTTALALQRLGPDHRFITRVEADALPDRAGRVRELRLIGGADPNLSARILPYDRDKKGTQPLLAIEALADALVARGLKVIEGDVVGDDTAHVWEPFPDGWAADDPVWEYGAPVSALTLNDNAFTLYTAPGDHVGDPGRLTLLPSVERLTIHNRTRTVASNPQPIRIERLPGSRELIVSGDVLLQGRTRVDLLAVDDPALFAAGALRDELLERGVRIGGDIRAEHRLKGSVPPVWKGVELARHQSLPLVEALRVINKVSQNLHTELVLREIARRKHGVGSTDEGIKEISAWLKEIGVPDNQFKFEDASGLSRLTLVTPATLNAVLVNMYRSPHRELWMRTLPVGGVDGTLEKRFAGHSDGARILAKTGSISHVSSLSGYALRKDGRILAFSILSNNYNAPHAPIRKVIDSIAVALVD